MKNALLYAVFIFAVFEFSLFTTEALFRQIEIEDAADQALYVEHLKAGTVKNLGISW